MLRWLCPPFEEGFRQIRRLRQRPALDVQGEVDYKSRREEGPDLRAGRRDLYTGTSSVWLEHDWMPSSTPYALVHRHVYLAYHIFRPTLTSMGGKQARDAQTLGHGLNLKDYLTKETFVDKRGHRHQFRGAWEFGGSRHLSSRGLFV